MCDFARRVSAHLEGKEIDIMALSSEGFPLGVADQREKLMTSREGKSHERSCMRASLQHWEPVLGPKLCNRFVNRWQPCLRETHN